MRHANAFPVAAWDHCTSEEALESPLACPGARCGHLVVAGATALIIVPRLPYTSPQRLSRTPQQTRRELRRPGREELGTARVWHLLRRPPGPTGCRQLSLTNSAAGPELRTCDGS